MVRRETGAHMQGAMVASGLPQSSMLIATGDTHESSVHGGGFHLE